jgi:hypothetical protein
MVPILVRLHAIVAVNQTKVADVEAANTELKAQITIAMDT